MTRYTAIIAFVMDCLVLEDLVFSIQLGSRWGGPEIPDIVRLTQHLADVVPPGLNKFGLAFDAHSLDEECLDELFRGVNWNRVFSSLKHCKHVKLVNRLWVEPDMDWYNKWYKDILDSADGHANKGTLMILVTNTYQ